MPLLPASPTTAQLAFNIDNPTAEDEHSLLRAFRSFADAAESLEKSYGKLRVEVARLTRELEAANSELAASLEENRSMRTFLDQILESLPCGVLVVSSRGEISKANPECSRLLRTDLASDNNPIEVTALPPQIQNLLHSARSKLGEQEMGTSNARGDSLWLAARHALLADHSSVFIIRDVSERKQLEEAQCEKRRDQALAEMSTTLAHEIRNPLGSLELFAGLLAESKLDVECGRWVEHVQAGTVVLGQDVHLGAVSILHGSFSIEVTTSYSVSQPSPLASGQTEVVPQAKVSATEAPARNVQLGEGASVEQLVTRLQAIGATARDVVSILQAIKAAGALEAELEVI